MTSTCNTKNRHSARILRVHWNACCVEPLRSPAVAIRSAACKRCLAVARRMKNGFDTRNGQVQLIQGEPWQRSIGIRRDRRKSCIPLILRDIDLARTDGETVRRPFAGAVRPAARRFDGTGRAAAAQWHLSWPRKDASSPQVSAVQSNRCGAFDKRHERKRHMIGA